MERIDFINADRLQWALQARGLSVSEVARKCQVDHEKLQSVLDGQGSLTFLQLKRVADECGRGVLFLIEEGEVTENEVLAPSFRTLANQKPELSTEVRAIIERVEEHRKLFQGLIEEAEGATPAFAAPDVVDLPLKEAADRVRSWLQLDGVRRFADYRARVESAGALVIVSNGYQGKWKVPAGDPICGFALYDDHLPAIFVTKQEHESRQIFTLMHELAHLILHQSSSIDSFADFQLTRGREREANRFAGYLLVPDASLASIDLATKPRSVADFDEWLRPARRKLGVSTETVLLRLLEARSISRDEYDRYRELPAPARTRSPGGQRFRHSEPRRIFGDLYVGTVLNALKDRRVTIAKASTYLDNLRVKDLRKLESAYAGV